METIVRSPRGLGPRLEAAGFRLGKDGFTYRSNGLSATLEPGWLTLRTRPGRQADPLGQQMGRPGLWKTIVRPSGKLRREFHLPVNVLAREEPDDDGPDGDDPLRACLDWAAATAQGELPNGWQCPAEESVQSWFSKEGLVLQSGPLVKQGSVVRAPGRLAVCFQVVAAVPEGLSPARRRWLERVLAEAGRRWRMVRVGLDGSQGAPSVVAEVDLSGAPPELLPDFCRIALDAVRWVVSWFLWPVALLSDTRVACRVWEAPTAGIPAERR
jgi:hypothetical protein